MVDFQNIKPINYSCEHYTLATIEGFNITFLAKIGSHHACDCSELEY